MPQDSGVMRYRADLISRRPHISHQIMVSLQIRSGHKDRRTVHAQNVTGMRYAIRHRIDLSDLVNDLLKREIEIIEAVR